MSEVPLYSWEAGTPPWERASYARGEGLQLCDSLNDRLSQKYRGTSLETQRNPLGPYRRPMPRVIWGVLGGRACSYGQGTPVGFLLRQPARVHQP